MKTLFEKLKVEKHGNLSENKSSWNTGDGFFPLYNYLLKYEYGAWEIEIGGELREWKFSSDNTRIFGLYSRDSYIWRMRFKTGNTSYLADFTIYERVWLYKLIFREDYNIRSKESKFQSFLSKNDGIIELLKKNHIYHISGKHQKDKFILSIDFSTLTDHEKRIRGTILLGEYLCQELEKYRNTIRSRQIERKK